MEIYGGNCLMRYRPDKDGTHKKVFESNKKKIFATQEICGICGRPVEKENGQWKYAYPHPLSPCIDHIIPINKGGHPSDINNLQLAHLCCNREKSDKMFRPVAPTDDETDVTNTNLPHSFDWLNFE